MGAVAEDWSTAACRDHDPELFFPVGTGAAAMRQVARAKRVCGGCAVSAACRQRALASGADEGVWGGLTPAERRDLRRGAVGSREPPRGAVGSSRSASA